MCGSSDSTGLLYAPFYCEENLWHLCSEPRLRRHRSRKAVFVSNPRRACALWSQRACRHGDEPIQWDYHAILIAGEPEEWEVWDQDSLLPCPSPLEPYLARTFRPLPPELLHFAPRFRIIDGETYRREFSSDRSHMLAADGSWRQPPPKWKPILRAGKPSFLRWTEMADGETDVVGLEELVGVLGISGGDESL